MQAANTKLDWEIWLDNHISPIIAKWLKDDTGWVVKSAYILDISRLKDIEIYQKAKAYGKVIVVSKDSDLPEIITRLGTPPKLIDLHIGNCDNRILYSLIKEPIIKAVNLLINFNKNIVEIHN